MIPTISHVCYTSQHSYISHEASLTTFPTIARDSEGDTRDVAAFVFFKNRFIFIKTSTRIRQDTLQIYTQRFKRFNMRVSQHLLLFLLTPSSTTEETAPPSVCLSVCTAVCLSAPAGGAAEQLSLVCSAQRRSIQCHTGETETTSFNGFKCISSRSYKYVCHIVVTQ